MNLKSLLVLLIVPIYGVLCWKYYVCNIKNLCPDEIDVAELGARGSIQFYKNSDAYILGDFEHYADSLAVIAMSDNIEIIGYSDSTEINSSGLENLGLARAHVLRKLLINRGLDSSRLFISSAFMPLVFHDSMTHASKVDLALKIDVNSTEVQIVRRNEIIEVYFPSQSKDEIKSKVLDSFLEDFVRTSIHRKVYLVGHTDNIGEESKNYALSLKRAETIRNLLSSLGMPFENMQCEGKGSTKPKVNNSSPENRAYNRRVEIILK